MHRSLHSSWTDPGGGSADAGVGRLATVPGIRVDIADRLDAVAVSEEQVAAGAVDFRVEEVEVRQRDILSLRDERAAIAGDYGVVPRATGLGSADDVRWHRRWCTRCWCCCLRGNAGIAQEAEADLVSDQLLQIVAVSVDVDVPGGQLRDGEGVIPGLDDAVAGIVLLDGVDLAGMRHAQLRPWSGEVGASRLEVVEVQQIVG